MRVFSASLLIILFGAGAVGAGPFDEFPAISCGEISDFELVSLKGANGHEVFTLWLHGYASGVSATDPTAFDAEFPTLSRLGDVVSESCSENPNGEISGSVLNRLLETID